MRRTLLVVCMLMLALACLAPAAYAKWWIFGRSEAEVNANYLYINGIAFDEKDTKITLYKDSLPNGMIVIRGKAASKGNKVGAVQVSVDNKQKWEKTKLSDNGAFEYSFTPDMATTYDVFVKIIDTTGKTNDFESTHKQVTISNQDMMGAIREALDAMIQAYMNEDRAKFMSYVSPDFVGDETVLDSAIRKDFSFFDNIDLKYSISSIASGKGGKIYVSIFYNRLIISSKTGQTYKDSGTTEFVFELRNTGPKVFSMKNPLIFGLSDAENVATGTVTSATNGSVLIVDPTTGGITTGPAGSDGGGALDIEIQEPLGGTKHHQVTYTFLTGTVQPGWILEIQEATSPLGPWNTEFSGAFVSPKNLTTTNIASQPIILYYRARIVDGSTSGPWSNVAEWDNN